MKFRKIGTAAALLLAVPVLVGVQGSSGRAATSADTTTITDPGPQTSAEGVPASLSSARLGTPDYRAVCTTHPAAGQATCLSLIRTDVRPALTAQPSASPFTAYGPPNFQAAYNLPSSSAGSGRTVAIVDAYKDPDAASDLAAYRSYYGLPPAHLTIVNQNGQASPLPPDAGSNGPASNGWALEESLDLDMVSAICPNCKILLVETDDNYFSNLGTGVNTAVSMGAGYVSNSYGGPEFDGESSYDTYYDHPGVAVTVSAGDDGYGVEYPAASRHVTAVGGTSLSQDSRTTRGWTETVWGSSSGGKGTGTGSGCSGYESKPAWQSDPCANRTVADVAADADPYTGAYIYDSYDYGGWAICGGTSEASPIIASVYALAGTPGSGDYPSSYSYASASHLNGVTTGSNGTCSPAYLCNGEPGYDGPTGLGTPNGVAAFQQGGGGGDSVTVTNPGSQSTYLGFPVSLQLHARSASGLPLTFSAAGLPPGLSIKSSGLISGTVSTAGGYPVRVTAGDGTASNSVTFNWTVRQQVVTYSGTIRLVKMGLCLDDRNNSRSNGAVVQVWKCTGGPSQVWQVMSDGTIRHNGLCLDAAGGGTANGTKVQLGACTGGPSQQWSTKNFRVNYMNPAAVSKVLDDTGYGGNGTQQEIWTNSGTKNQYWATS